MIRLHHAPGTRSMRILWLLHELAVDFDLEIHAMDGSLRDPAYLALNPAGRVPTLEIDGMVIRESGAAVQVLCERFDPRGMGRPVGHSDRAAWLDWIHYAETISVHCANLAQQHIFLREDSQRSPIIMKLEAARLARTLVPVNDRLVDGALLRSGFSAADICVGQAVYAASHFVRLDGMERLTAWFASLAARDAYKAACPDGDGIYGQAFYAPWPVNPAAS